MVVEDEVDILTIIEKGLENNGFKVIGFADPEKAIQHFEKHGDSFDLVVTDARMPAISGFQLARRVKDLQPTVKVILISAFEINKSEFEKVMPHTHVDGFLSKPFLITQLIGVISTLD